MAVYKCTTLVRCTVGRCVVKTSNPTVSGSSLDLEISILTKACSPRVLDQPVVHAPLSAISHNSDLVVEVVLTAGISRLVTAPSVVIDAMAVVSQVRRLEW